MTRPGRRAPLLAALLLLLMSMFISMLPGTTRAASPGTAGHDLLLLRTGAGPASSLVALQVGGERGAVSLPLGLLDSSRHTLYVAIPRRDGAHTLLRVVDAATGRTLRAATIAGAYSTQTGDYSAAALSFDGSWLALRSLAAAAGRTRAVVIDTATLRVVRSIDLAGRFGLDAIDQAGSRLYLIEHLNGHGPGAYRVRSYEVQSGVLDPGALFEKDDITGTMSGVAWTRAWSPGGTWLFTLYVRPGHKGAFVHSLGVEYRIAQCIFPPTDGATASVLSYFTVTVSPDGTALYAVNPLLGQVFAMRGSLPFGSTEAVRLTARAGSPARTLDGAAISRDGQSLFVATDRGIWVLDTTTLALRATYLAGRSVASVVVSDDGRRLYALEPGRGLIAALDLATGRTLGTVPAAVGSWAIASVASNQ